MTKRVCICVSRCPVTLVLCAMAELFVSLRAHDGALVRLSVAAAKLAKVIADVLPPDGVLAEPIPMPALDRELLLLVVDFLTRRAAGAPLYTTASQKPSRPLAHYTTLDANGVDSAFSEWVSAIPMPRVFDLLRAGELVGSDELQDLAAMRIALQYLQMPPSVRDAVFAPATPLTAEDEATIRARNTWAEEEPA